MSETSEIYINKSHYIQSVIITVVMQWEEMPSTDVELPILGCMIIALRSSDDIMKIIPHGEKRTFVKRKSLTIENDENSSYCKT